jgi:heme-degrading monooxygenase HmoA
MPPGWKASYLLRDSEDSEVCRLSTLWESREALEQYRGTTKVPAALALFRSVGVEPHLRIFEVPVRLP